MGTGPFTVGLPHRQGMGLSDRVSENSLNIFQAESGTGNGPFTVGLPHRRGMGLSDGVSENGITIFSGGVRNR